MTSNSQPESDVLEIPYSGCGQNPRKVRWARGTSLGFYYWADTLHQVYRGPLLTFSTYKTKKMLPWVAFESFNQSLVIDSLIVLYCKTYIIIFHLITLTCKTTHTLNFNLILLLWHRGPFKFIPKEKWGKQRWTCGDIKWNKANQLGMRYVVLYLPLGHFPYTQSWNSCFMPEPSSCRTPNGWERLNIALEEGNLFLYVYCSVS